MCQANEDECRCEGVRVIIEELIQRMERRLANDFDLFQLSEGTRVFIIKICLGLHIRL